MGNLYCYYIVIIIIIVVLWIILEFNFCGYSENNSFMDENVLLYVVCLESVF